MRRAPLFRAAGRGALLALALLATTALSQPATAQRDPAARRAVIALVDAGQGEAAMAGLDRRGEPVFSDYVMWLALIKGQNGLNYPFDLYREFLRGHAHWPQQNALRRRAEQALVSEADSRDPSELRDWFKENPPVGREGRTWLAGDLLANGRRAEALALIQKLWRDDPLSATDEAVVLSRFGGLLTGDDHRNRVDSMIWRGQFEAARRMMPMLTVGDRLAAEARIKLVTNSKGATQALAQVPPSALEQPGLLLERIKLARAQNDNATARALLMRAPPPVEPQKIDQWWKERDRQIRRALDEGDLNIAYRLAAEHNLPKQSAEAGEAEFIAGWLALRKFRRLDAAARHFTVLTDPARHGAAQARGHFWLARTAEADNSRREAAREDSKAAQWGTSFYGQISLARLGDDARLPAEPRPSDREARAFNALDLVQVVKMLAGMGEQDKLEPFIARLTESQAGVAPVQFQQTGMLAQAIGRPDLAIWIGRRAMRDGVILVESAYPDSPWPLDAGTLEPAFTTAIVRQESSFRSETVSRAGARGVMQCMPDMAKETTKALGLPYDRGRLLSDPVYNLTIGQTYVAGVLARFDGSYALAAAGFNAGPGRTSQWVASYGDPRTDVDPLDWLERIPFEETRNYVQRVIESTNIYRMKGQKRPGPGVTGDIRGLMNGPWCTLGCPSAATNDMANRPRPPMIKLDSEGTSSSNDMTFMDH